MRYRMRARYSIGIRSQFRFLTSDYTTERLAEITFLKRVKFLERAEDLMV